MTQADKGNSFSLFKLTGSAAVSPRKYPTKQSVSFSKSNNSDFVTFFMQELSCVSVGASFNDSAGWFFMILIEIMAKRRITVCPVTWRELWRSYATMETNKSYKYFNNLKASALTSGFDPLSHSESKSKRFLQGSQFSTNSSRRNHHNHTGRNPL